VMRQGHMGNEMYYIREETVEVRKGDCDSGENSGPHPAVLQATYSFSSCCVTCTSVQFQYSLVELACE
jgi:hypothetical protein